MNIETLKEIVKVAKDQGVAELKLEVKDFKVEVSFLGGHHVVHTPQVISHTQHSHATSHASAAPQPITKAPADKLHVIKSPFVGTFYASPGPGKPAYAKVGDKVKAGQPLCVLEAMKIMNEIDSDIAGEIAEICVENESLVEFGQPLFKIKPN